MYHVLAYTANTNTQTNYDAVPVQDSWVPIQNGHYLPPQPLSLFGGWFGGDDLRANYPAGTDPVVLGESANTITTYGYDPATGMQEPKVTLCQIRAA